MFSFESAIFCTTDQHSNVLSSRLAFFSLCGDCHFLFLLCCSSYLFGFHFPNFIYLFTLCFFMLFQNSSVELFFEILWSFSSEHSACLPNSDIVCIKSSKPSNINSRCKLLPSDSWCVQEWGGGVLKTIKATIRGKNIRVGCGTYYPSPPNKINQDIFKIYSLSSI